MAFKVHDGGKKDEVPPPPLKAYTLEEFTLLEIPPREMVLEPWLRERDLVEIYAWRGMGKSYFAMSIGLAIASGDGFLIYKSRKARNVLLVDGEMDDRDVQDRFIALQVGHRPWLKTDGRFRILCNQQQDVPLRNLASEPGQRDLDELIDWCDVLILDNRSCLFSVDDTNSNSSWEGTKSWLLSLRRRGKTVLYLHHAGKNGLSRGSSGTQDPLNSIIHLKRPDEYQAPDGCVFNIRFDKARGLAGPDVAEIEAKLEYRTDASGFTVATWSYRLPEDVDVKIRRLVDAGLTVREIAADLEMKRSTVQDRKTKMSL